jgi:hypothetical protein
MEIDMSFENDPTLKFVREHADDDVMKLALKASEYKGVDMDVALMQIAGRQMAKRKLPTWSRMEYVLFPPHINLEQCSSEKAARYKAVVAARMCGKRRKLMVDLTGGYGVDFTILAQLFDFSIYVERDIGLCEMVFINLEFFNLGDKTEVHNADGTHFLKKIKNADLIYIDPSRRDDNGGRTYALSDCEPDALRLLPEMMCRGRVVMMKLSPMLDWHKLVADLKLFISEIHIVSVDGECKELLAVFKRGPVKEIKLFCATDNYNIHFKESEWNLPQQIFSGDINSLNGSYLYEPDAAMMKAGCFGALCHRYHVKALDENSHLFVRNSLVNDFPGRKFLIKDVTTMNKHSLADALKNIDNAAVAVRNFPLTADALAKRLKLKNGSDKYVFGTTAQEKHIIIISDKI